MFSLDDIRREYAGPVDEERVWVASFGQHYQSDTETVREVVEEYADRIEGTYNAVTHVDTHEPPQIGVTEHREVLLAVIIGRTADRALVDRALETVDYEIRDAIHRDEQRDD